MRFKEGDLVSVIASGRYTITDIGSYGIIVEKFKGDSYEVKFIHTTGKVNGFSLTFDILNSDLDYCYQPPLHLERTWN